MAALETDADTNVEIDVNCMCLFVPVPRNGGEYGTVHVLMPCTHDQADAKHVVRMFYRDSEGKQQVAKLEGWGLTVGSDDGSARTTLTPSPGIRRRRPRADLSIDDRAEVVDLNVPVPQALVQETNHAVISRIRLNTGEVVAVEGQLPPWNRNGKSVTMAHRVTWRVKVKPEQVQWKYLSDMPDPPLKAPFESLAEVQRDRDGVYRLHVHHVSSKALTQPNGLAPDVAVRDDALTPEEVISHFKMFYQLLGIDPGGELLPEFPEELKPTPEGGGATGWACRTAQAQLES